LSRDFRGKVKSSVEMISSSSRL